ncbi:MAG TPA: response regulator transcription factor [Candidatus Acidoferrales bacterium]|nr:response regulator transcription factor [Candidatus Acidoferrales bacterium]
MRILVVEDEKKVASFIKKGLEEQSYAVDVAYDGRQGEDLASHNDYDLIILDILLPVQDGVQTCQRIRGRKIDSPILMLTAIGDTEAKVRGLDSGADDYLTKPFHFEELLARVRALLRRKSQDKSSTLQVGELMLDPVSRKVERDGRQIRLTSREFALLEYFMRNNGKTLSRVHIAQHVWNVNFDMESNVIDVYVKLLRQKVDKDFKKQLIHTVIGAGYVLKDEDTVD